MPLERFGRLIITNNSAEASGPFVSRLRPGASAITRVSSWPKPLTISLSAPLRSLLDEEAALACALGGGDDYVLAFTLPPAALPALQATGQPFHLIGRVAAGSGVHLLDRAGRDITPAAGGYQHFGGQDGQA